MPTSDELADRLSAVEQEMRAVGGVVDHGVLDVDAELVIERGEDILIVHGPILRFLAQAVGRTDHLAHPHAAAGQEGARGSGPVVAAGGFVDPRRAAEFAPGDHADVLVQAAGVQVFDQSGDSLIELVELRRELGEVAAVPVPTAERKRDAAGPCFDQTPGQQELVHPVRAGVFAKGRGGTAAAVAIAELGVFAFEVERFGQFAGREDLEGGLGEGVEPLRRRPGARSGDGSRRSWPSRVRRSRRRSRVTPWSRISVISGPSGRNGVWAIPRKPGPPGLE